MNSHSANTREPAIFVHSLFRTGSTYLFNVFRRSPADYWCYQEPENEFLRHLNKSPEKLLEIALDTTTKLRHPKLEKPYFWEFYALKEQLAGLFEKSFSYDEFFIEHDLPAAQLRYFVQLIKHARGRPLLQFCRSFGRIGALHNSFDSLHIHLWRNPRSQWWSYKINYYFDATTQLILRANTLPPILDEVKRLCGLASFHHDDVDIEFGYAKSHELLPEQNYLAFYALWLFSFIECDKYADIDIDIERLSNEKIYRDETHSKLQAMGINGLNFDDCALPLMHFSDPEAAFFAPIERRVDALFMQYGYTQTIIDNAHNRQQCNNALPRSASAAIPTETSRARATALRYLQELSLVQSQLDNSDLRRLSALQKLGELERDHAVLEQHNHAATTQIADALKAERQHSAWLQGCWDDAKQDNQQLRAALQHWTEMVATNSQALADQQTVTKTLSLELDAAKLTITQLDENIAQSDSQLAAAIAKLATAETNLQRELDRMQLLENEWNAEKTQHAQLKQASAQRFQELEMRIVEINAQTQGEQDRAQWLENEWNAAKWQHAQLKQASEQHLHELEMRIAEIYAQARQSALNADRWRLAVEAMQSSSSWRITKPVRRLKLIGVHALNFVVTWLKANRYSSPQQKISIDSQQQEATREVDVMPNCSSIDPPAADRMLAPAQQQDRALVKLSAAARKVYFDLDRAEQQPRKIR